MKINFNSNQNQLVLKFGDVLSTINGDVLMVINDYDNLGVCLLNINNNILLDCNYSSLKSLAEDVANGCSFDGSTVKQVIPADKLSLNIEG